MNKKTTFNVAEASAAWVKMASDNARKAFVEWLNANHIAPTSITALGFTATEVSEIFEPTATLSILTFAKMLIVSGHAMSVRKLTAKELAQMEQIPAATATKKKATRKKPTAAPANGNLPEGVIRVPIGGQVPAGAVRIEDPSALGISTPSSYGFEGATIEELREIAHANGWDANVNINAMSRATLLPFVEAMSAMSAEQNAEQPNEQPIEAPAEATTEQPASELATKIASVVSSVLESNPQLGSLLRGLI